MDAPTVIGVRGDKGQVAALFNKPCLLFDDKEANVDLVRQKGADCDGIVVKRHRYFPTYEQIPNFRYEADPYLWPQIIRDFCDVSVARGWDVLPCTTPPAQPGVLVPRPLPRDWEATWDYQLRRLSFTNLLTRQVTWDRPQ